MSSGAIQAHSEWVIRDNPGALGEDGKIGDDPEIAHIWPMPGTSSGGLDTWHPACAYQRQPGAADRAGAPTGGAAMVRHADLALAERAGSMPPGAGLAFAAGGQGGDWGAPGPTKAGFG